jgi:hypothetical protein
VLGEERGRTAADEVVALRAAHAARHAEKAPGRADLAAARDRSAPWQARSADLEQRKTPPPACVQAQTDNTAHKEARGPRKKRDPRDKAGRGRAQPTQRMPPALERCRAGGSLLWSAAARAGPCCAARAARGRAS